MKLLDGLNRVGVAVSFDVLAWTLVWGMLGVPRTHGQQLPTATEILDNVVRKNAERQAALEHYSSERTYRFEYDGIGGEHLAELVVQADYRPPGHKHFNVVAERGSKPFCEKVLRKIVQGEEDASNKANQGQTPLSTQRYDAVLVGEEKLDGIAAWVLDVTPKAATRYDYRGRIWVSQDDSGIMRVVGTPAKSPSWLVEDASFDYRYERVGIFWLPAKSVTTGHVRLGGESHLTISYGTYAIEQRPNKTLQTAHLSGIDK